MKLKVRLKHQNNVVDNDGNERNSHATFPHENNTKDHFSFVSDPNKHL